MLRENGHIATSQRRHREKKKIWKTFVNVKLQPRQCTAQCTRYNRIEIERLKDEFGRPLVNWCSVLNVPWPMIEFTYERIPIILINECGCSGLNSMKYEFYYVKPAK